MSRSYNDHKKSYDGHMREAKHWANKNRRTHGKRLIKELEKAADPDDIETSTDVIPDAGKGDIWIYDQEK